MIEPHPSASGDAAASRPAPATPPTVAIRRSARPPAGSTGRRLADEWERLRRRPRAIRRATTWGLLDTPVRDLDEILRAVGYETTRTAAGESRLRRLVELAADDDLAARVVVERILPGLLAVVRRRRPVVGDDAFDELLGAAWVAIRTFNPARRPACLAAALIADADYAAFRRARRRIHPEVRPVADLAHLDDRRDRHPFDELAELFRDALDAGVPADDIALLRRLLEAPDAQSVADQLRITTRTIRNRRNRIATRLREVTLAA